MRRALLSLVACVVLLAATSASASTAGGPKLPLGHAGRWITDASGRVYVTHGINMVYKLPPYYPAAIGFGDNDAAFLRSIGFTAVRVGVLWEAVEPQPGVYDDSYLNQIAATVATLAAHGITSLLDFHQDLFNEKFQGEGEPAWAVQDGGLPNPTLGFPGNYLANPALEATLDHFWQNSAGPGGVGLQDRYAAAWAHVAARFKAVPGVLGYEIFNEPFPGTLWEPCAVPTGCPAFDAQLGRLYARVIPAIRAVDPRPLIFYEPNVLFNDGPDTLLPRFADKRLGFAFHDYCLTEPNTGPTGCSTFDDLVFSNAVKRADSTGDALLETEFGATNDIPYLDDGVALADSRMVPWLEWAYCGCMDPTTSGPGAKQAIVLDPAKPPVGSNLVLGTLKALVEPYPQLVAGTPLHWSYAAATRTFTASWSTARAAGGGAFPAGSRTEIAAPALAYPEGYAVEVQGGRILSAPGAPTIAIASCPGVEFVSVTVFGTGPDLQTCAAPPRTGLIRLRLALSRTRLRAGVPVVLAVRVTAAGRAVKGVLVTVGRYRARTDAHGVARLHVRFRTPGRRTVLARARGARSAVARLTVIR